MSQAKTSNNVTVKILTPLQCRMARAALHLGVREIAEMAEMSPNTVARFERGEAMQAKTLERLQAIFEKAGVEFIPENGGGEGVRLAKPKK